MLPVSFPSGLHAPLGHWGSPRARYNARHIGDSEGICWNELCPLLEQCYSLIALFHSSTNKTNEKSPHWKKKKTLQIFLNQNKKYDHNVGFLILLVYLQWFLSTCMSLLPRPVPKGRIKWLCLMHQTPLRSVDTSVLCVGLCPLCTFFFQLGGKGKQACVFVWELILSPGIREPALPPLSEKPPKALCRVSQGNPTS